MFLFGPRVPNITTEELARELKGGSVRLIDVREPSEFAAGHVPGAVNMPLGTLPGAAAQLDRDAAIIVICQSGNRSVRAVETAAESRVHRRAQRRGRNGRLAGQARALDSERIDPWAYRRQASSATDAGGSSSSRRPPSHSRSNFLMRGAIQNARGRATDLPASTSVIADSAEQPCAIRTQHAIATARCRPSRQWQSTPPPAASTGIAAATPVRNRAIGIGVSGESVEGACTHSSG